MKVNYPLLVLAIGASGIGTTEFLPMGLLPVIARGVDVSIPAAGMLISAYAVSVVAGTPLVVLLLSHRARHSALIFLMAIFTFGNVLSAITPDYMTLMPSHILTSLNHGTSFGLGSVVTASVVPKHEQANTVATMFMGLTLANIDGMPAVTWLGETIGRQMSFLAAARLDVISVVSLFLSLPKGGAGMQLEVEKKLTVLMHPQVLSTLLTTVLGAGAMSTLYTYISPVLQSITHATPVFITAMLMLIGVGFSIGNYLGGELVGRLVNSTLKGFLLLLMVIILTILFLARNRFDAATNMVVWGATTFAVIPPLQMRVMRVASEASGLSSSVNIGALNLGNTLGVAVGDAVVPAGLEYSLVPVMGAIVTRLVLLLVFVSARKQPEAVYVTNS